jgi:ATP-binding cassette, subfamily C (CFTR/MRP), member 1
MTLFLAVGVALLAVGLRNSTSAGFLGVTLSQLVNFSTSLQNVILAWTRVENGVVAVERVREICSVDSEQDPPQRDIEPSATQWPSTGRVEFKNVTLRYKMDQEPALKDVSLDIPGGSTMGVCGRTGFAFTIFLLGKLLKFIFIGAERVQPYSLCWEQSILPS